MLLAYKASLLVVVVESAFARQSDSVYVQYGAATCQRGVVNKFLKVPLASFLHHDNWSKVQPELSEICLQHLFDK